MHQETSKDFSYTSCPSCVLVLGPCRSISTTPKHISSYRVRAKEVHWVGARHRVLTLVKQNRLCEPNMLGHGMEVLVWVRPKGPGKLSDSVAPHSEQLPT